MTRIEEYIRPDSIKQAVQKKASVEGAVFLAGGTQVNRAPLESPRPRAVVDLRGIVPEGLMMEGTDLVIGAMTTIQELMDSDQVFPVLREASGFIPTRSIRNQATVGGNIAARRPDSYLIPAFMALAAVARTTEGNISVEDYVSGDHDELILDIHVPVPVGPCVAVKESRSHVSLPVVSAAVSLTVDAENSIGGVCLAVGCVDRKVRRLTSVEETLVDGGFGADAASLDRAALEAAIAAAVEPRDDILGSIEYKKYVNGAVIADAVIRCGEAL